jgi:hypothetical protein
MTRFLTTAAVIGLLAAPAWAQTMNSAPGNSGSMSAPAAGSTSEIDRSKPSAAPRPGVTQRSMPDQGNADQGLSQANPPSRDMSNQNDAAQQPQPMSTTKGSGSSTPRHHMAKAKRSHAEDNNADELNRQELQQLGQK